MQAWCPLGTPAYSPLACGRLGLSCDGGESVSNYQLVFRIHALQRMSQRHIEKEDIRHIIETGTNIEIYPQCFPSSGSFGHGMAQ